MRKDEKEAMEVASILDRTAALAFKMQTDEFIKAFEEAEATCLSLVSAKEQVLEIKRRVVEWKLRLLCDRNASFGIVDKMHNSILELGYSNLENEGNIELYFAQYCIRQNQTDIARRTLRRLCLNLDNALKTSDLEVYRYFKDFAEDLLKGGAKGAGTDMEQSP
jgi:hypothetical protein